jgi:hypothetical protein
MAQITMSHVDKLRSSEYVPAAKAEPRAGEERLLDWPMLVVILALGSTVTWGGLLLWLSVRAIQGLVG